MTRDTATDDLTPELATLLRQRQAELARLLRVTPETDRTEVVDFKDMAADDAQSALDEATQSHAAQELADVGAALRRIEDGTYGACVECGAAIDPRRLRLLPATPYCTACQGAHEFGEAHARRH